MNWRLQTTFAGILGALGLWITFNPITVVSAAGSVIPWLLLAAGAVQLISIAFCSRRLLRLIIVPAITGALFIYASLSMKFGDPKTVGPVSLVFVLALVFFGTGAAKLFTGFSARRSRYFYYLVGSGAVSVMMGLIVLFNWQTVSNGLIAVFLGLETLADALVMAVPALRDRDGEVAMETLGLDPAAEAAEIQGATVAAQAMAAAADAAMPPPPPPPSPPPVVQPVAAPLEPARAVAAPPPSTPHAPKATPAATATPAAATKPQPAPKKPVAKKAPPKPDPETLL